MRTQTRWWALSALVVSMLTIGLDTTVLSVALPTLSVDLHASTSQLQWITTCYTLVLAALLLPAGALGERYGYKKLLLAALLIFGASSVWCAYSGSAATLIAARSILGIGAALTIPLSMAVLPSIFPDATERARALNIWVTSTAIGMPLGPIIGGWLLSHAWWGSIFLINVPLVIVGFVAVAIFIPESKGSQSHSLDLTGVALSSAGLAALTFGFIRAGQQSWSQTLAWGPIAAGVVFLALFVMWQMRCRYPLVDLTLFKTPGFRWGTTFATLMGMSMFGVLFALPLFYQAVQGNSTLATGVRLLPLIAGLLVGTRIADRFGARMGDGMTIALGFAVAAASLGVGALTHATTPFVVIGTWLGFVGVGMGLVMPTAMNAALGALQPERAGTGSALTQAFRQAGGTIGVALLGTVLNAGYRGAVPTVPNPALQAKIDDSVSAGMAVAHKLGRADLLAAVQSAFVHGMSLMLLTSGVAAAALAVAAAVVLRRPDAARHRARHEKAQAPDERQSRTERSLSERQSRYARR
ncbi:MAG TPA: DHA2 family efflux MFS transporter permease subunit [Mycobacterium sp.]|nr:DHA2 family efflux MFS transporter permease subunit [Mycobacterium sp.]